VGETLTDRFGWGSGFFLTQSSQSARRKREEKAEAAGDRDSFASETLRGSEQASQMVAEVVTDCQQRSSFTECLFERVGRIRISVAEVERIEGVGRGVMGLIRRWKCVEKWEGIEQ
jgi:hypothetical protein